MSIRHHHSFAVSLGLLAVFFLSLLVPAYAHSQPHGRPLDKHTINIELDFEARRIEGSITIAGALPVELRLVMNSDIEVKSVLLRDDAKDLFFSVHEFTPGGQETGLMELVIDSSGYHGPVTVSFVASVAPLQAARQRIERGVSFSGIAVMGTEGAFLPSSSYWFPRRPGVQALYDITISLPSGYLAVMEGELIEEEHMVASTRLRYRNINPTDGVNLVAGPYAVTGERYKGIDISTYFYKDDPLLARTYIDKTKEYLDIYEGLLPEYPYKKFVVVENFLPTGFGMPSFTLLGSVVLRLPFIPDTALGHEFVHNWWGNGVLIDPSIGNWSEALTSYMSDHLLKERVSADQAASYRLKALYNYANYARESTRPVKSFTFGSSPEARALGYSKAMMIFHMLKLLVGDEIFYESLRRFYVDNAFTHASWDDIRIAFEEVSKKKLGWFFAQWLLRPGGPELSLEEPKVSFMLTSLSTSAPAYRLRFVIRQKPPLYRLKVPILIETEAGEVWSEILLKRETKEVKLELTDKPLSIEIDPKASLFRVLSVRETPVSIASLLGDKRSVLVLPSEPASREKYLAVVRTIQKDYGLKVIEDKAALKGETGSAPLFIFGGPDENALFDSLSVALSGFVSLEDDYIFLDKIKYKRSDIVLVAALRLDMPEKKPRQGGVGDVSEPAEEAPRIVGFLFGGLDAGEIGNIAPRISHLTSKGYLVFTKGGGLESGIFPGEKALRYELGNL